MRILRVRRGFTTNSSGANEFLPTSPDAAASASASASARPPSSTPITSGSGGPALSAAPAVSSSETLDLLRVPTNSSNNGYAVSVICVAVLAAFAATPLVRFLLRKRRPSDDDGKQ